MSLFYKLLYQHGDSERGRSSRNGSASKRAVVATSKPSSSCEPNESRLSRLLSASGRMSTAQRTQPGFESKSSNIARGSTIKPGGRDEALRSFEFLSIGSGKKK